MDFVEQLKSSVDIVRVVGEYVRLKRAGASPRYTGLCPFHSEKTPSFSVHASHQFYKCFGCGAGGDVIKFVMEIEGLSFFEALKLLAEKHGIPMPRRSEYSDPETRLRSALMEMHETAQRLFRNALLGPGGAEARAYLARRAVGEAAIEEFGLGLAERSGQMLARRFEQDGRSPEQMEASGLVLKRQDGSGWYDRFRGRLMFPIHSESGKVVAFAGRALAEGDEPKYLNSPETPIYRKSQVLYNLHRAKDAIRRKDQAILVEGYMDVIGVYAAGIKQVVASCGTALTDRQVRLVRRHSANMVVNFDPDAAGANAAERSIQMLLDEGMQVRILDLEPGLDPDEYIKQRGLEAYQMRLERAGGYFHWLADRARARHDTRSAEGRVAALRELLPVIQRMRDKLERAAVAGDVASYLGVDSGLVLEQFRKASVEKSQRVEAPPPPAASDAERTLLRGILSSPELRSELAPLLKDRPSLLGLPTRGIFQAVVALEEGGSRFSYADLNARLSDSDQTLLGSLVLADKLDRADYTMEVMLACLASLDSLERKARLAELRARLKQAERAGDLEEAMRLAAEMNRLSAANASPPAVVQ